jgi:putative tricarboxylic transport membrane protein
MKRRRFMLAGTAAMAASGARSARADGWPRRPLTILVPFDVGGSADRLARGFAQYMPRYLGQPITVVERAGAGGLIGTTWFMQQPTDGYTVMLTPATPFIPINILVTKAHFTLDDFTFVNAQWTDYTNLVVPTDRPWRTAAELIDAIRAKPGTISTGVDFGSVGHISTIALLDALGLRPDAVRMVTFDGAGAMRSALAGGQVDFNIGQAEGAEVVRDFVRTLAVFLDHPLPGNDAPPINDVLNAYNTSVPLIDGSVRTFVFPAAFKSKHPEDYAMFVSAYRATLDAPEFRKWLHDNQMGGNWVGEERTHEMIYANYEVLKKYKDLIKS